MAKRYCDGCGRPLEDRESYCQRPGCLEKIRAKLTWEEPRSAEVCIRAPKETHPWIGGPLGHSRFADELPKTFKDATPLNPEDMRYPWAFAQLDCQPDHVLMVGGQPQIAFRPECFRVSPECASHFVMTSVRTANVDNSGGGADYFPCDVFAEWKRWDMETITPSNRIQFLIKNISKVTRTFRAVLFGRVAVISTSGPFMPESEEKKE